MEVRISTPPPVAVTYDITGLTEEEITGLLSVLGKFADNPSGDPPVAHWHTHLYSGIARAVGHRIEDKARHLPLYADAQPCGCAITQAVNILHCRPHG